MNLYEQFFWKQILLGFFFFDDDDDFLTLVFCFPSVCLKLKPFNNLLSLSSSVSSCSLFPARLVLLISRVGGSLTSLLMLFNM